MVWVTGAPWAGRAGGRRQREWWDADGAHGGAPRWEERAAAPVVEVSDTAEAVVVTAQVPGVTQADLQWTITAQTVTLHGTLHAAAQPAATPAQPRAWRYGTFVRTVAFPAPVWAEQATVHLREGVLAITIPKRAPAAVRPIFLLPKVLELLHAPCVLCPTLRAGAHGQVPRAGPHEQG